MKTKKSLIGIGVRGLAMGAADLVPGVSGGTVAFITGIYEELIETISNVNLDLVRTLKKEGFKAFWQQLNGRFILPLIIGIIISMLSLANLFSYLLDSFPVLVWSFFFGLVIASIKLMTKQVKKWNTSAIIGFVIGAAIAFWVTVLPPNQHVDANWYLLLSGAIAICAMILPGISGAFILLLLGSYQTFVTAIKEFDLIKIAIFGLGCIIGLLSFSHLLKWMFKKYEYVTIAVLSGFLLGSLNKLWPWKEVISTRLNRHGETVPFIESNVSPFSFETLTNTPNQIELSITFCIIGFLIIFVLERFGTKKTTN
jgi:putative membrane protein